MGATSSPLHQCQRDSHVLVVSKWHNMRSNARGMGRILRQCFECLSVAVTLWIRQISAESGYKIR